MIKKFLKSKIFFDGFDEMKKYVKNNINKCVFVEDIDNDYIHMLKRILKDQR